MEKITAADWDLAEALDTKEDILAHLEVALADNDGAFLREVISALARAKGMTELAREVGVTREGLYKSLAPNGNPSFDTIMNLLDRLGFRLRIERKEAA
jgi:probable addiction module antidote protein